ncbi:MAG TPA: 50S ribosomal protein L9 [Pyrinomonadaceae bacterium]|jgi:large subunit ribosomal protein L9|nr:50S ribosomal protein L9 [Pyrinomonadaceae bacterium]
MASTTILLREDIDELGGRGEIVKVRAGYARNYLLPKGLASLATKGNVRQIEQERAALLKKAAVEKATAEAQKEQMGVIELSFERQAGEHGTLFGSVTSMDIAEALREKGYEIDRRKVVLRQPIKETGDYTVKVRLHREVLFDVPVHVTAVGGEEPAEEPKAEKKTRRGKRKETNEVEPADTAQATAEEAAAE